VAKLVVGENDLYTKNKALAEQWHPTLNGALTPHNVLSGSGRKVWWICKAGHEWEAQISNRTIGGTGCRKCSRRNLRVAVGFKDLATVNPELAKQWHPTLNGKRMPQDVLPGSGQKAWWICKEGHEWEAVIWSRSKGSGCRECSGRSFLIVGSTDLATVNPELAKQWHPTLNGKRMPQDVLPGSNQKTWWVCKAGHEWEASVNSRSAGRGCPNCCVRFVGVTENAFREAFEKFSGFTFESTRISLIRESRSSNRAQIDMLNDDLKLVIEYDGEWTHGGDAPSGYSLERNIANDKETTEALSDIGYKIIRIREHGFRDALPFIPMNLKYDSEVFQIQYKSFGKDKDDIEELVQRTIAEKEEWFKVQAP
jgi:hypothetical protein